ncbi:MAG: hypothetical protein EOP02_27255 [Proteobacteria bacterium]|nr:MAG: hypothetical protein EOP02_27255 [Pseudomonadota bacterium]
MTVVNVPGVSFPFPGKTLVIPPLALGDLEQLLERINAVMAGNMDRDSIATVIDATHAALRRNFQTRSTHDRIQRLTHVAQIQQRSHFCTLDVGVVTP